MTRLLRKQEINLWEVITVNNRAKQFMPFAALKGYYDLISERQRVIVPKRELCEDDAQVLSDKLNLLRKGCMVRAVYYNNGAYISKEGIVTEFYPEFRYMTVVKTRIDTDSLLKLEILTDKSISN